jgi:hypothetical protein
MTRNWVINWGQISISSTSNSAVTAVERAQEAIKSEAIVFVF